MTDMQWFIWFYAGPLGIVFFLMATPFGQILLSWVGLCKIKYEKIPIPERSDEDIEEVKRTVTWHIDQYAILYWMSFGYWILRQVAYLYGQPAPEWMLVFEGRLGHIFVFLLLIVALPIFFKFFKFVSKDMLGARQTFRQQFFTNCRVFQWRWLHIDLILLPNTLFPQTIDIETTVSQEGDVTLQVDNEPARTSKRGDDQKVKIALTYKLNVFNQPDLVTRNYLGGFKFDYDNNKPKFTAMNGMVQERLLIPLKAAVDEVLQGKTMQDLLFNVGPINRDLEDQMRPEMRDLGLVLQTIHIDTTDDKTKGGFKEQLFSRTRSVNEAETAIVQATADRQKRTAEAERNAEAVQAEQDARRRNAEEQSKALVAVLETEKRNQEIAIQAFVAKMEMVAGKADRVFLAQLSQQSPEQMHALAIETMKNMGIKTEGGSLGVVGDPLNAQGIMGLAAAVEKAVKMFKEP